MVVVTGATGHIGNVLVRLLLQEGYAVKAIYHPKDSSEPLEDLEGRLELCPGDILDLDFLTETFAGEDYVFHLAAMVDISSRQKDLVHMVNVEGTKNVIEACLDANVGRLIYTSSTEARVEPQNGMMLTEETGFDPLRVSAKYEYPQSKAIATLAVKNAVTERGLDAVIVSPSGVVGPYDFKPSMLGSMMLRYVAKKLPAWIKGGYDFADVRDVAKGHLLAARYGKTGEDYILSGEHLEIKDLITVLGEKTGLRRTLLGVSQKTVRFFAHFPFIRKREPILASPNCLDILKVKYQICYDKASEYLGYKARALSETIGDTLAWFYQKAKIPPFPKAQQLKVLFDSKTS